MTNKRFHSKFFSCPLKLPINVRGQLLNSIETFSIFEENNEVFSCSFLPGFHQIDLLQKEHELLKFLNSFSQQNLTHLDFFSFNGRFSQLHPEIQFTIESFFFNYCYLKKINKSIVVKYNYLFNDPNSDYEECIKIKVSPQTNFDDIFNLLKNPNIFEVRFDGNQSFNQSTLQSFLEKIPVELKNKISYFEEPIKSVTESISALSKFKIDYAIDESFELANLKLESGIKFIILKPSLIGFFNTIELINDFHKQGIKVIISSAYETEQSYYSLIYLADYFDQVAKTQQFHGLDTFKFFGNSFSKIKTTKNKVSLL